MISISSHSNNNNSDDGNAKYGDNVIIPSTPTTTAEATTTLSSSSSSSSNRSNVSSSIAPVSISVSDSGSASSTDSNVIVGNTNSHSLRTVRISITILGLSGIISKSPARQRQFPKHNSLLPRFRKQSSQSQSSSSSSISATVSLTRTVISSQTHISTFLPSNPLSLQQLPQKQKQRRYDHYNTASWNSLVSQTLLTHGTVMPCRYSESNWALASTKIMALGVGLVNNMEMMEIGHCELVLEDNWMLGEDRDRELTVKPLKKKRRIRKRLKKEGTVHCPVQCPVPLTSFSNDKSVGYGVDEGAVLRVRVCVIDQEKKKEDKCDPNKMTMTHETHHVQPALISKNNKKPKDEQIIFENHYHDNPNPDILESFDDKPEVINLIDNSNNIQIDHNKQSNIQQQPIKISSTTSSNSASCSLTPIVIPSQYKIEVATYNTITQQQQQQQLSIRTHYHCSTTENDIVDTNNNDSTKKQQNQKYDQSPTDYHILTNDAKNDSSMSQHDENNDNHGNDTNCPINDVLQPLSPQQQYDTHNNNAMYHNNHSNKDQSLQSKTHHDIKQQLNHQQHTLNSITNQPKLGATICYVKQSKKTLKSLELQLDDDYYKEAKITSIQQQQHSLLSSSSSSCCQQQADQWTMMDDATSVLTDDFLFDHGHVLFSKQQHVQDKEDSNYVYNEEYSHDCDEKENTNPYSMLNDENVSQHIANHNHNNDERSGDRYCSFHHSSSRHCHDNNNNSNNTHISSTTASSSPSSSYISCPNKNNTTSQHKTTTNNNNNNNNNNNDDDCHSIGEATMKSILRARETLHQYAERIGVDVEDLI